ncbi:S8 family peptidase [Novipirellula artificiosorum]|uniref:Subtilisin E n=1 Tax=Novipirellula artificiosorum TaxID=2528016 RepID=A0A5C6E1Q9_9BACT|nr:S8 family serine peptidase [Novipirellula artificiosorum]TWU42830.1 Subtilisin E precursor [Novipirellula artificiosorum]
MTNRRNAPSLHDRNAFETDDSIQACEERYALSASLPGDLLLEVLPLHIDTADDTTEPLLPSIHPSENTQRPDLLEQAADLRALAADTATTPLDGHGQTVAVIDSGVAWDHVALGGGFGPGYRVVGGWDFAENDSNPYDDGPAGFHGSHVAGLLAGESEGFSGVAPGADLVALRVFDDAGRGELAWIESSLKWVHEHRNSFDSPITTVNLSVGAALNADNLAEARSLLADELQLLREDNILVFAAAGNFFGHSVHDTSLMFPASSESVVAVGSVDDTGLLSSFSQRASGLLATSGESIRSAVPEHVYGWDGHIDDFATLDGTSMATPQIAAASMLVRQSMIDQGLEPSADDILARLHDGAATKTDPQTGVSYSVIDLQASIHPLNHDTAAPESVDTNLADFDGKHFLGSNENDSYVLDLRNGIELRNAGQLYRFDSPLSAETPFSIDVGAGADSLQILGSNQAERLILFPGSTTDGISRLSTNTFEIELRGVESVVFDGGGGPDRATLYDSIGNDILRSQPNSARLSGVGFEFQVNQVDRIYVHANAGGEDHAFLSDSEGDDTLSVKPQFSSLRSKDTFQAAYGFERLYAYSTAGGHDSASLYDSVGDDTMNISSSRSMINGPGYQASARGFQSIEAFAINGGEDIANLYTDDSASQWDRQSDRLQWTSEDGSERIARGFERMQAFEQYQPIELSTPSTGLIPLGGLIDDDPEQRLRRERLASQSVFDWLGES